MSIYEFVREEWEVVKKMTISEIAHDFEITEESVMNCLSPIQLAILAGNEVYISNQDQKFTDEKCIQALQSAQTFCFPLSAKAYATLVRNGDVDGPSVPLLNIRFGSWSQACRLAGVESGEAVRDNYDIQFTDQEILLFVRRFLFEQEDGNWSLAQYVKWREESCEDAPSMALIRNRLGSWTKVRVEAIDMHAPELDLTKYW